jgi:hypothetical protein
VTFLLGTCAELFFIRELSNDDLDAPPARDAEITVVVMALT